MDLKLDANHDLLLENSDLVLTTEEENIIQLLDIRLQFFKGEWFLDILAGIPYIDEVLIKGANIETVKAIFIKEILASDGVDEILALELSHDSATRILRVDFSVKADNLRIDESVSITI